MNIPVIVYVKHYLTPTGVEYFQNEWFPLVYSIISKQAGFASIAYSKHTDNADRIDISLKFEDETTFNAWLEVPMHDELIAALDMHRSRGYWEFAKMLGDCGDDSRVRWTAVYTTAN